MRRARTGPSALSASAECIALCIPPARVRELWPLTEPMLRAAIARGRISDFAGVQRRVFEGAALLWIVWDGKQIKAAAVTELQAVGRETICTIVACGGRHARTWIGLIDRLEAYAKAEGCRAMRFYGRNGWLRMLPDYRAIAIIAEKQLNRISN